MVMAVKGEYDVDMFFFTLRRMDKMIDRLINRKKNSLSNHQPLATSVHVCKTDIDDSNP